MKIFSNTGLAIARRRRDVSNLLSLSGPCFSFCKHFVTSHNILN